MRSRRSLIARAIADLERDIRALSVEDRRELLDRLIDELEPPDEEIESLVREFVAAVERADRSLKATIDRIDRLDEDLERAARETRARVIASGERWPFPLT